MNTPPGLPWRACRRRVAKDAAPSTTYEQARAKFIKSVKARRVHTVPMMRRATITVLTALAIVSSTLVAQDAPPSPRVQLLPVTQLRLPGLVDSNSPAVWERVNGRNTLFVVTSWGGQPSTASGTQLLRLGRPVPITLDPWPGGGVWMEAIVPDADGTWYGYYHNEIPATVCRNSGRNKVIPRIGAARSTDRGLTWESIGIVLEAPPTTHDCITNNQYFVGGVGDFSVQLDADGRDLYFFYTQYHRLERLQGVGVARLAWADRDAPTGKAMVWQSRRWVPTTTLTADGLHRFTSSAVPIFPAAQSWHDEDTIVDAFWGPSVHWNTYLGQYVMLLNRAKDAQWTQEGIYVSFAPRLDDPRLWSAPVKILNGGDWYPQVMGLEIGTGTDKTAGQTARFFMNGTSQHIIQFIK